MQGLEETTRAETAGARYGVRVQRNVLVPLADGAELAADLYLPDAAGPYPALVSYYPYHKDDLIGSLFEHARHYFAARGYASLLVDFRGTGGSTGVCTDTFDAAGEGKDGAEVVEWAAVQDWCTGSVGVWGMSYGGILSLAIAAQRPPHLKAMAPLYGCDDIWKHFVAPGGSPNCLGNYARESFMLAMDLAPPMLQDDDGRWLRVWKQQLERFEAGDIHSLRWQARPDYDEHWRTRTIAIERIQVPGFFVGGWRDIFPEAVPDAFARLDAPKRLLMGPWVHTPPDWSPLEPVDWLYDVTRWWDRWLKDDDNGIDAEPPVTMFVQGAQAWRHEPAWPIARTQHTTLYAASDGRLAPVAGAPAGDAYETDPTVGTAAGLWDPLGIGVGYPLEQSGDDLRSLTYTSEPLAEDTEVTGSPEATVHVTLEHGAELQIVAKLNAVAPDGSSTLLSTGWLNARHRDGADQPAPVEPGTTMKLVVPMWATSYLVPKGSRLRLSLACADFPRIWPTRQNPSIRCLFGGDTPTAVRVPIVSPSPSPTAGPPLSRPEPDINRAPWITAAQPEWEIRHDAVDGTARVSLGTDMTLQLPSGARMAFAHRGMAAVTPTLPHAASVEAEAAMDIRMRCGEHVQIETRSRFTRETMLLNARVLVDGRVFFDGRWSN
jgi:putative CocE/NonD family hydrolase